MVTIHTFDQRAVEEFHAGNIWVVLATSVKRVCSTRCKTDRIASTHRGQGHAIAKGRYQPDNDRVLWTEQRLLPRKRRLCAYASQTYGWQTTDLTERALSRKEIL